MDSTCQHIIEPGHMGGNCKLCGWSEIAEWYGMYDDKEEFNFRILTKEEIAAGRSSAYEYLA